MTGEHGPEAEVNWDGILEEKERRRIHERIHSAMGAVGARIPEVIDVGGRRLRLKDAVFSYLDKQRLSAGDIEDIGALIAALQDMVSRLEKSIDQDEMSESGAVGLMRDVLGILRALEHLRKLRNNPKKAGLARETLMERVDDERRWLAFLKDAR